MAASDQIRQMVNFILQEAHEKANEIRVKVRVRSFVWVGGGDYYSELRGGNMVELGVGRT